jgi:predicted NUDIX family NTP pyrophosphohydrolase
VARKISSGTLLYRRREAQIEVLLVHPSGAYNKNTPWGIPKGYPNEGEPLEDAARRETWEETGLVAGELTAIGHINYRKTRKQVHAFAGAAPETEPRCASWEVDRAEFVPLERARAIIHPDQAPFLDRLCELLGGDADPTT